MKRFLSLVITVGLLMMSAIMVTSCGGGGNNDTADVHVFYYSYSDTYISSVRNALDRKLREMNVSFQDYDANSNQTTQAEQVQTAITKGAKVIAVNIVTTGSDEAANGIVALAKNAGIPVIFFNREVSDAVVNSYDKCVFVGTDAAEAGHLQGEMIGEYVKRNYEAVDLNKDGEISYVMFMGEKGNNEAIFRTRYGVEDADRVLTEANLKPLKFYDPSNTDKYLVDKDGKWSASAANEYMTTALASYNEANNNMIELVICNNDGMAEGAISALNTVGYNTGGEKMIPVFGVDATDAAQDLIKKGQMAGTIKQDADGMAEAISIIIENGSKNTDLFTGMTNYNIDKDVRKLRIAYSKYLGE